LECQGLRHEKLKTLIIETADISADNIEQLCSMKLHALEYFELWFGRHYYSDENSLISNLAPVFEGKSYPNLKYLGLCSCESIDSLLIEILASSIQEQLVVLNLQRGTLEDIDLLLKHQGFPNLRLLDVSSNNLEDSAIARLNDLPFEVITENQDEEEGDRHNALYE
jgi:hypothetical protein